jgi:hypothetical protein
MILAFLYPVTLGGSLVLTKTFLTYAKEYSTRLKSFRHADMEAWCE